MSCQPTQTLLPQAVATTTAISWGSAISQEPRLADSFCLCSQGACLRTAAQASVETNPDRQQLAHPELPSITIIQLQDVAVSRAVSEGWSPPGQGDAVVPGAALLQLQQGYRWHYDRDHSGQHTEPLLQAPGHPKPCKPLGPVPRGSPPFHLPTKSPEVGPWALWHTK